MKYIKLLSFALTYIVGYARVVQFTKEGSFTNRKSNTPVEVNCNCDGQHYTGFHFEWFKYLDWKNHPLDYHKVFECDKNQNCNKFFKCDKNRECINIINTCHENGDCIKYFNTCDKSNNCLNLFGCATSKSCERTPIYIEDIIKTCECTTGKVKPHFKNKIRTPANILRKSEKDSNDWLNIIPYTFLY